MARLDKLTVKAREALQQAQELAGARSQQAAHFLAQNGHKTRNMTGGMLAWKSLGLPTET